MINFFNGVAQEAREIMAKLGVRKLDDLIGRPEFLKQRHIPDHPKANTLDLAPVLKDVSEATSAAFGIPADQIARTRTAFRNDGIHKPALDLQIIEDIKQKQDISDFAELADRGPIELQYTVVNTDRNLGTRTSGAVAMSHGKGGLPCGSIILNFNGSAGQSLGTFLSHGIQINVTGEGNDYVGKGMSGGRITVKPHDGVSFIAEENSIVGNTCLYGATGGRAFFNGRAGERFGVRNSGAHAVVEGVGDHGCEYMTNGLIIILGTTGKNFGAGMSGGTAYVYDEDGIFQSRINPEMVVALPVVREQDKVEAKTLIEDHLKLTGSNKAKQILTDWEKSCNKLMRVIPKAKATLEAAEEQHEAASTPKTVA